jgi:predicted HNH restriction endonuclease
LKNAAFGHPVYERYPDKPEFFYGIYEYGRAGLQRNKFERLVGRAADFFQSVAEAVSGDNSQSDRDTYQTVENRRAVAQHLRRERKGYVATLRKQSDNYICQICRFDFSKFYGELGNDFAEAHHIVPLSANSKLRTITVDDLVTVCANCHRMLHRMSGKPKDLADLKSRVRRGKRA